jgi:uncharacterized protein (UPF0264 family)
LPAKRNVPLLLASVTGPEEAAIALREGADILDAKDPREGSLGACAPSVLRAIVALRGAWALGDGRMPGDSAATCQPGDHAPASRRVAVSAALGDAPNLPGTFALAAAGAAACGVDYLKIGLRGVREEDEAHAFLRAVVEAARQVSPAVRVVAAAYAEASSIGAISPARLPRIAERAGAHGCLIDTALKEGRSLLDHLDAGAIARFIAACRQRGLLSGLAGSLGLFHVPRLLELGPDVIGVRGAICDGGRSGRLDPRRLRSFRDALDGIPVAAGHRA